MTARPVVILDRNVAIYIDLLRRRFSSLRFETCLDYADIDRVVKTHQPEVILCNRWGMPYPRAALIEAPSVRWVHAMSSGVNHLAPWDPQRVTVTNSAGIFSESMAQYALGMILMFSQRIPTFIRQQQRREWKLVKVAPVQGKLLCVLGAGSVGGQAAARCKALGMHVVGVRARPRPTPHIDEVVGIDRLHDVLARADFVLNCLPLTEATRGLMNAQAFAAMKKSAYYINIGRGAVDDEPALIAALRSGALAGAAIDVFQREPLPKDSELWQLENLVITPHSSGEFPTWEMDTVARFMDQLDLWLAGKELRFVADPGKGY